MLCINSITPSGDCAHSRKTSRDYYGKLLERSKIRRTRVAALIWNCVHFRTPAVSMGGVFSWEPASKTDKRYIASVTPLPTDNIFYIYRGKHGFQAKKFFEMRTDNVTPQLGASNKAKAKAKRKARIKAKAHAKTKTKTF